MLRYKSKSLLILLFFAILFTLAAPITIYAASNITDDIVDIIFQMDHHDDLVDFLVLLDNVDDPTSISGAYAAMFAELSPADQDLLADTYHFSVEAVADLALIFDNPETSNLDETVLKAYIAANDKAGFKQALFGEKEDDLNDAFAEYGITTTIFQNGLGKLDNVYDALFQFQDSILYYRFLETNHKYGRLVLDENTFDHMISLAEGLNMIGPHDNQTLINAVNAFLTYYNNSANGKKDLIYDYFDQYNFIRIISSGQDEDSPEPEPEVEEDYQINAEVVSDPEITDGVALVEVDGDDLLNAAKDAVSQESLLNDEIAANGGHGTDGTLLTRELQTVVNLHVPETGADQIKISFPAGALDDVFSADADTLRIETEFATFYIEADTFTGDAINKSIMIIITDVSNQEFPANVPEGSLVIDIEVYVDGIKVDQLNHAVKVGIHCHDLTGETVTAFLLKDDGTAEPVGGLYDSDSDLVHFYTDHFSKYFIKANIKTFSDLGDFGWARPTIEIMAGKGFLNGVNDNEFAPKANITRAEFCALIARMFKMNIGDEALPFTDVSQDKWYYDEVKAAYECGVVKGKSDDIFDPEGLITRQEIAVMTARILESHYYLAAEITILTAYQDEAVIAAWAKQAAATIVREKIITSIDGMNFAPQKYATRAEAAVILYRLYQKVI